MADAVEGLQNIQRAERTWHENQWSKQSRLHAQIESVTGHTANPPPISG